MNKRNSATKLLEWRDLKDKCRYLAREETTHTKKKVGSNASTDSRDTARDLLLEKPVSDRFGNRFFGIAPSLKLRLSRRRFEQKKVGWNRFTDSRDARGLQFPPKGVPEKEKVAQSCSMHQPLQ